jgi:hypothetical protein
MSETVLPYGDNRDFRGEGGYVALVQPHLLEGLGRPICVMLDDVARDVIDRRRDPRSDEEKSIQKVLDARDEGHPIDAVSFDAPDIIAALPEAAVRRLREHFTSWDEMVATWDRSGPDNFKTHVLRSLGWKLSDDRGFISSVLDRVTPADELPKAMARTRSELLAWADSAQGT